MYPGAIVIVAKIILKIKTKHVHLCAAVSPEVSENC